MFLNKEKINRSIICPYAAWWAISRKTSIQQIPHFYTNPSPFCLSPSFLVKIKIFSPSPLFPSIFKKLNPHLLRRGGVGTIDAVTSLFYYIHICYPLVWITFYKNNVTLEVCRFLNEKKLAKCDKCETQLPHSFTSFIIIIIILLLLLLLLLYYYYYYHHY